MLAHTPRPQDYCMDKVAWRNDYKRVFSRPQKDGSVFARECYAMYMAVYFN